MEGGATYAEALAEAQRLGYAEADPTDDVSGADAAAKMAILATVAFGSRVTLDDVEYEGIEGITPAHVAAARELGMVVRLVGARDARRRAGRRPRPAGVRRPRTTRSPRSRAPFNAVMLQGDAIREITLEGPGAGGIETASAVVADMVCVIGTTGTGLPPERRVLARARAARRRASCARRSTSTSRSTTGPACSRTWRERLAAHDVSVARLVQQAEDGGAGLHIVTHEAAAGQVEAALAEIAELPDTRSHPSALPVISDRGVPGLGWS